MSETQTESKTWVDKFLEPFENALLPEHIEAGMTYVKKRRSSEFLISNGAASVRIQDAARKPIRARLSVPVIPQEHWKELLSPLSKDCEFLSLILSGELSDKFVENAQVFHNSPFPKDSSDISLHCSSGRSSSEALGVLYVLLGNALEKDPFNLFLIRGLSREELLFNIRESRGSFEQGEEQPEFSHVSYSQSKSLEESVDSYWESGKDIFEFEYSIVADELPAALLRRLDPLPIGGEDSSVDAALEEAYAHVATRAQAFGLGI